MAGPATDRDGRSSGGARVPHAGGRAKPDRAPAALGAPPPDVPGRSGPRSELGQRTVGGRPERLTHDTPSSSTTVECGGPGRSAPRLPTVDRGCPTTVDTDRPVPARARLEPSHFHTSRPGWDLL